MFKRQASAGIANLSALSPRVILASASLALVACAAFAIGRTVTPAPQESRLARCDARIKSDVRELDDEGLEMIDQLRPVGFRYNRDYAKAHPELGGHEYFGVIAQQYATVFPRFVRETDEKTADGQTILAVDLQPALIHAIGAIQQLHAKSIEHDRQLLLHEQNIAALTEALGALKDDMNAKDALLQKAIEDLTERVKKGEDKAALPK